MEQDVYKRQDQYQTLTYQYEAADSPNRVIISKKQLTTKEELPGASLEAVSYTHLDVYKRQDHRTEGELHINKRDKELFELEEDSYGKVLYPAY